MKPTKLVQLIILMCGSYSFAQFGVGTTSPNPSAQLEVVSNDRGILIPQLALTSTVDTSTITHGNIESLLVYNTSNASGLTPGYYYWSSSKWNRLATTENSSSVTVDDNLTSTSTANALSAYQGLVLKGLVDVNTTKVGITTAEANAITVNTAKTGITVGQSADIAANKTGVASNGTAILTKVDKVTGKELSANDFTDALKAKLDNTEITSNKNIANGYVGLDANTKIDVSYLPSITINNVYTATSLAQQNALTPNTGDVVIRTDESKNYIYDGAAWLQLASPSVDVSSVNGKTGVVTIGVGDIATLQPSLDSKVDEVTGKELSANDFTDILKTKLDGLSNTMVANNLTTNSITEALSANQGVILKALVDVNTAKTGISTAQASAIVINTAKIGITTTQAADIAANKTGVAANVTALGNKADKSNVLALDNTTAFIPDADYEPATKKYVDDNSTNTTVTDNLTSTSTTTALSANQGFVLKGLIDTNTAKTGISTAQASAIVANTAKVVITTTQASEITANTTKVGITTTQAADIAANKAALPNKVDVISGKELSENDFTDVLKTKLDGLANTTVIDDLTTGGTDDALSAEQGKTLQGSKVEKSNVLELDNTTTFTPDADYEPATKKYVDDNETTVVNDLTTGGTDDALSAEQGKELEDAKLDKTLADGTIFIGNGSGNAVSQTISSDATITNTGVLTIVDDAVDGTDIKITSEAAGSLMYNDGADWVDLPAGSAGQSLVMNTGADAPEWQSGGATEDVEVVEGNYLTTATSGTPTLLGGSRTWNNLIADYETIKIYIKGSAGDQYIFSTEIKTTDIVNDILIKILDGDGNGNYGINMQITDTSLSSATVFSSNWTTASFKIVGVKAQKTVVNPTDALVIDDDTFATATAANVASAESVKAYINNQVPIGTIVMWGTATVPAGWLELDGQVISAVTYPDLNTMYGANVPDFRGYFPRAAGTNTDGTSSAALLTKQGDAIRNISGQFGFTDDNATTMRTRVAQATGAFTSVAVSASKLNSNGVPGANSTGGAVSFNASNQVPTATENRPNNISVKFIIKAL